MAKEPVERFDKLGMSWGPISALVFRRMVTEIGQNKPGSRITTKLDAKRLAKAAGCTVRLVNELKGEQKNNVSGQLVYQNRRASKIRDLLEVMKYTESEFMAMVRKEAQARGLL